MSQQVLRAETLALFFFGFAYALSSTLDHSIFIRDEPLAIATSIVEKGVFADPYAIPTGPTAHMAPLFPLYLALFIRILPHAASAIVLWFLAAAFHGILLALLPYVSGVVFSKPGVGFLAGVTSVTCSKIWPEWDCSLSGPALVLFCALACRIDGKSLRSPILLGAFGGLLLLLNPVMALPAGIWAASVARIRCWPRRSILTGLGSLMVVCLPWTVRNYAVLGALIPIRDNFGLELQVSNNDYASPSMLSNAVSLRRFHPATNREEAERVRRLGEVSYNREKLRQGISWIASHSRRFASLTIQRWFQFWFPPSRFHHRTAIGTWVITLLSIPALILVVRRRLAYRNALIGMLVFAPLPFYLIQTDLRYRTPLLWISLLLAAYSVETMLSFILRKSGGVLAIERLVKQNGPGLSDPLDNCLRAQK